MLAGRLCFVLMNAMDEIQHHPCFSYYIYLMCQHSRLQEVNNHTGTNRHTHTNMLWERQRNLFQLTPLIADLYEGIRGGEWAYECRMRWGIGLCCRGCEQLVEDAFNKSHHEAENVEAQKQRWGNCGDKSKSMRKQSRRSKEHGAWRQELSDER